MIAKRIDTLLVFFALSFLGSVIPNPGILASSTSATDMGNFEVILQSGHSRMLSCIALSPNDRLMLTGGWADKTVKLWDVKKDREIRTLAVHQARPIALMFSAEEKRAYIVWFDGLITEVDIATGTRVKNIQTNLWTQHSAYGITRERLIQFSSDSQFALFGTRYSKEKRPGFFILWDLKKGREIQRFRAQAGMKALCMSPDGRWIVSAADNKRVVLWDIGRKKPIARLTGLKSAVVSLAFSGDNHFVAIACDDGRILLWNLNSKKIDQRINIGACGTINQMSFSRDGRYLYYNLSWPNASRGQNNPLLCCMDVQTGKKIWSFNRVSLDMDAMALATSNRYLAVSYLGKREHISLLDCRTGRVIERFEGYGSFIQSINFSKDGSVAASANYDTYFSPKGGVPDSELNFWALRKGRLSKTIKGLRGSIEPLVFSPGGEYLACGAPDEFLEIYDATTGEKIKRLKGPKRMRPHHIAFSPDGELIAATEQARNPHSASANEAASKGDIRVWNVRTGKLYKRLKDRVNFFNFSRIVFTADGRGIIYKARDDGINTWHFKSDKITRLLSFKTPHKIIGASSEYLVLSDGDQHVSIWNVNNNRLLLKIPPHATDGKTVAVSSDGRQLLTTRNGRIILWDPKGRRKIRSFEGHTRKVTALAFDRKERQIISAGKDNSIRIWNRATGQEIAQCLGTVGGGWIVMTSEGYYNASLHGHEFLNIVQGLNVYGINQFYDVFYRPDLVEMRLQG